MPKDILEVFKLSKSITISTDPSQNTNTVKEVELPKCPKCNKIPLKCPNPDDCGMENL